ncbi:MAG: hypothetical protein DRJ37_06885 [Thermoprotei archaeon]|nr:MAG: hypothetical protein DRJ37_06885 [Thermoprotei archaeon]
MYIDKVITNTFYLEVNDVKLRVFDSGREKTYSDGTTLFFLHGSPGQISNWKYLLNYFKKHYRTIAYDLRGYGMSSKPKKVSLEDYLRDQAALMKELGVRDEDAVLIGHSFGGLVAQEYAARRKVKAIILIGSLVRLKPDMIDWVVWNLPSILWRRLFFTENMLTRRLYRRVFFSVETPDKIYEEFIRDNKEYLESLPAHAFRYLKYFKNYDASKTVSRIRSPTLIIVGEEDQVTPVNQSETLNRLIKNSILRIIPKAGHLVLYEKPEILAREIHSFIKNL